MEVLYWVFILSVVIATFVVIIKSLTKQSYWIMLIIAILYTIILTVSFLQY
ncbi:hypothetical protein [Halobacillus sp. BBL2006]|uniref:hypothetical protein n=1 Tax=Halobacillus sp. BBL2006 TaxID=1543706 RepID=UPI000B0960B0|nr:hypothetical protein [Halobacillus sp. BBL2006]